MSTRGERGDARPLPEAHSFTAVVVGAWRIYRASFLPLLEVGLGVAALASAGEIGSLTAVGALPARSPQQALAFFFPLVAWVVLGSMGAGLAAVVGAETVAYGRGEVRTALPRWRPALKELFAAGLLASIVALVFTALTRFAIYFGLFLIPLFFGPAVVAHIVVFERTTMRDALGRARSLLRGHSLRLFGYLFAVVLLVAILHAIVVGLVIDITAPLSGAVRIPVRYAVLIAYDGLAFGYLFVVMFIAYVDVRSRAEDLDAAALLAPSEDS